MKQSQYNTFLFNWKYKGFEIRTTTHFDGTPYIELVKWNNEAEPKYCYTLAYYKWDDEGGNLIFVGNRPFKDIGEIDIESIWRQLWFACEMFRDWYEKERN